MTDVVVCWGPECAAVVEQKQLGRAGKYHSPTCRTRAARRNGGKAPLEPYPPLEPGVAFKAAGFGRPPKPKPEHKPAPVRQKRARKAPAAPPEPEAQETPEAPAATVTQLHVAVTEDATVPVTITVHPMVAAYKADLEKLGHGSTRQGQQVVTMAEKLVSSATSPAAAANLSKELERLMQGLVESRPESQVSLDPSVAIRERTIAKLRAVAGEQSERAG